MVDFVCFREDNVVMLENNGVGVDSALRVNKEGKKDKRKENKKCNFNLLLMTCFMRCHDHKRGEHDKLCKT